MNITEIRSNAIWPALTGTLYGCIAIFTQPLTFGILAAIWLTAALIVTTAPKHVQRILTPCWNKLTTAPQKLAQLTKRSN